MSPESQPDSDPQHHLAIGPESRQPDSDSDPHVQTVNINGGSGGAGGLGRNQGIGGSGGTGEGPTVTFHNSAQQLTMINIKEALKWVGESLFLMLRSGEFTNL
ncbi:hypothetical protein C8R45DRAFT_1095844 [Mycena sanguinolenta]|nr:hypothetical protein C8R45DRAFT_1095844 [Mycena sanguinolenta]